MSSKIDICVRSVLEVGCLKLQWAAPEMFLSNNCLCASGLLLEYNPKRSAQVCCFVKLVNLVFQSDVIIFVFTCKHFHVIFLFTNFFI